ncbi:cadherin-18-like isoform X1 [Sinocyclocheilus anshuiensis]|uniref:cadherin-18-like isoform X1 n=1 Tax=Sinocyclocheilus anshuiensis TaxID=1608454 RepID=UPI0007BA9CD2|nr:PREDICTED: cadherin-18-like isoform X1 [Sinocyclocheilus anshuiensis]XP_016297168.1 PREDICTED: cadherin-18-like isoform X1 [Sinocyclocheilus anshuiensis]XP_016297169.1 PREDICTED: cadherin-18-like isoform X1 [Sinocyclocheilus anshuiensis]XP_016297170.1 PREDICTED: cadherin-18-like isoform X1 [Sinocyclocheilus anshuiensis]XP_016297171.1 PREDICTED: cadherin-18-like isoform X1 [Sinocyclocheilus anshuiensis]XP_016297172.1 PREDICTED: cadherin-18-like isoform X1 [Sinocyclocheilus anshuiensis]XP_01
MKVNPRYCLCPVLLCLCFLERGYEASHHGQAKIISRSHNATHNHNQTKDGETEVHHRPKRGWIWNQFFVLEEHIGPDAQYVGKLHSNSDKGDGSVRYILSGEGAGSIFIINEVTGDIHATKSLDREKKSHYVLHAQAINLNSNKPLEPESEFIIKVQDINDNAPKFPDGPFVTSVPEMSEVGTSVFQVTATDADDPTYGNSARVVYSILHGQPYFSVDPKSGIIRTALADMDREAREHYSVVIQAKDMAGQVGGLSGSTTVNITLTDVNDNPPKFPQKNYQVFVPESAQVGKPVGKMKASDEDIGINAEIKYSILNPEGAGMFSISTDKDTREGVITLRKPLNYEKKKHYSLHIAAENTHLDPHFTYLGSFKDDATLKITVGDVDEPPVFSMDYYIMEVYENTRVGTEVGAVTARDPDSKNSPVRYFIEQREDKAVYFDIESISGVIRTTQLLDREDTPWHNITVMATEEDNPSLQSHVPVTVQVLDVNDNPPMINTEDEIIICESTRAAQVIQTITAVDKDDFANGKGFSFSFPGGIPDNPNFTIKDNEDSTASIIARRRRFHRLTQELYELPVVVWDDGEPVLSSTSTLMLRVCSCQRGTRLKICQGEAFLSSAGLSTGALIAILLCVLILLAIVILFITLRRSKKEPLIISEEDIRENVVTYDDEGGGEEDTEAFDIIALRNPAAAEELKFRRDVRPECIRPWSSRRPARGRHSPSSLDIDEEMDIGEFIKQRVVEADQDTSVPPYDSLQTYAYEGQGSPAGSISSLGSAGAHSEVDYNSLDDWGPKFEKIAGLYGEEVETASESTEKAESEKQT